MCTSTLIKVGNLPQGKHWPSQSEASEVLHWPLNQRQLEMERCVTGLRSACIPRNWINRCNNQHYWLPAPTRHRCRCSRWENNSCCWFVWPFKAHILDCTILQLGLHILLFGLHKIGWTAPIEYALQCLVLRVCLPVYLSVPLFIIYELSL